MEQSDHYLLRRLDLFDDLADEELCKLTSSCSVRRFHRRAPILVPSNQVETAYFVLSGLVGLFWCNGEEEVLIDVVPPGRCLALASIILQMPNRLVARMLRPGDLLAWPARSFRSSFKRNMRISRHVYAALSRQWREMDDDLNRLRHLSARDRLLTFLLESSEGSCSPTVIQLPGTKTMLAGKLGITLATLSRCFSVLRPFGVSVSRRYITVEDVKRLRESLPLNPRFLRPGIRRRRTKRLSGNYCS